MRSFLVDINPNIELPEYNLVLYSLYEKPITELYNITNFNIKPFFIGIDEINFNIPMTRNEVNGQIVRNEIYDIVDGEYYIKLNDSKFFVINKINEKTNDGSTYKEVSAYSREAELNQKRLVDYKASSRMLYDRYNTMLEDENGQLIERGILNYIFSHITKAWAIGEVDEKVVSLTNQGISRELNFSNSSLIQVFQELQKTYNCIFKFNTTTQVVDVESAIDYDLNVEDIANSPQYKGLYISDENFIKNMSKNIEYDKIKTRLFLYGKDNISIQSIHPTGQPYIDNFSAFKSTKFMTQELIDGLNAYDLLIENANPNFTPLLNQLQTKNAELEELYNKDDSILVNKGLVALRRELSLVQTNIDTRVENLAIIKNTISSAEGIDLTDLYTQMKTVQSEIDAFENQKANIKSLITTKESQIETKKNEITSVESQIQGIRDNLSVQANLAPHLVKELDKFIRVETYNDSNFTENNIMELYEEGNKNLAKISQPSIQFDVDVVDFLSIVECQHTWDKLVLGDIVLLENKNIGFSYYVRLVGYEHNPDNNSLNLKFSNTNSFDDATLWIKDLLEQMSNATSTLDFNKYKWDKTENMQDRISIMVDEKLEEARQNIMNAVGQRQLFEDDGLWLIKENPDGTLDDAQIRAINNTIALTEDNWQSVGTAITPKGIVAQSIYGKIGNLAILNADQVNVGDNGETLSDNVIGSNITRLDKDYLNGIRIDSINGIVATRNDQKVKTYLNATSGIKIETKLSTDWEPVFSVDLDGNLKIKGNITLTGGHIDWDSVNKFEVPVGYTDEDTLNAIKSTYIDANGIWTPNVYATNISVLNGKIQTAQIEDLVVGGNVTMGNSATIKWTNVDDKPTDLVTDSKLTTELGKDYVITGLVSANLVKTGVLQSQDGSSWINLDNGTFNLKDKIKMVDGLFSVEITDEMTSMVNSKLELTETSLTAMISTVEGDVSTLQITAQDIQTQVTDNAGHISSLNQTAEGIVSSVTSLSNTVTNNYNTLTGELDSITTDVYSEISQLADDISLKVTMGEVTNYLSVNRTGVTIAATNIDLNGITNVNSDMRLGNLSTGTTYLRFGSGPLITGQYSGDLSNLYISASKIDFVGSALDFTGCNIIGFAGGTATMKWA